MTLLLGYFSISFILLLYGKFAKCSLFCDKPCTYKPSNEEVELLKNRLSFELQAKSLSNVCS